MKGFAQGLVLKQRHKVHVTQKWPIHCSGGLALLSSVSNDEIMSHFWIISSYCNLGHLNSSMFHTEKEFVHFFTNFSGL